MEEARALKELRKDWSRVIPTAEKGMIMMLLNKQDYINKAQDVLSKKDTYRPITVDPITKHGNNLINILGTITAQGGLGVNIYKRLSHRCSPTKHYRLPNIHNQGTSLGPLYAVGV